MLLEKNVISQHFALSTDSKPGNIIQYTEVKY